MPTKDRKKISEKNRRYRLKQRTRLIAPEQAIAMQAYQRNYREVQKGDPKFIQKRRAAQKLFHQKNPQKRGVYARRSQARKTPQRRLHSAISVGVQKGLRHRGGSKNFQKWIHLVGYSIQELMDHLEKLFLPGMTWENYGRKGWNVDHIIPQSKFQFTKPTDVGFKECWALSNLQPLWETDNLLKGDRLPTCAPAVFLP